MGEGFRLLGSNKENKNKVGVGLGILIIREAKKGTVDWVSTSMCILPLILLFSFTALLLHGTTALQLNPRYFSISNL